MLYGIGIKEIIGFILIGRVMFPPLFYYLFLAR